MVGDLEKKNRHTRSSRDARYVYFTSFDLITDENKAINVKFTDNRRNSEFYAPVVKFCKNKGTSAVMSRYPHTGYHSNEFTVKEKVSQFGERKPTNFWTPIPKPEY